MRFAIIAAILLNVMAAPGIARSTHYRVAATLDPAAGTLAADVTIDLTPQTAGQATTFLLGRTYGSPRIDAPGATVDVVDDGAAFRRIKVTYAAGAHRPHVRFRYGGPLNPSGDPPLNSLSESLIELNLDSMWLPIDESFGTRFTSETRVSGVPAGAIVVGQGRISRRGDQVRLSRTVPDVDVAFAAARGFRPVDTGPFRFYARNPDAPRAQEYRRHGAAALAFLEQWFGVMPGKPVTIAMVERPRISGYARRGYVVVTDGSAATEAGVAKFVAHELAHGWFSNALPVSEDRWIDESISEYVGMRYLEQALGRAAMDNMLAAKRNTAKQGKAILGGVRGDAELYSKGPVLLFALEGVIGRGAMDELLSRVASHRVARTDLFLQLLSDVAGRQAADDFERILRS